MEENMPVNVFIHYKEYDDGTIKKYVKGVVE